jgi:hypothetical protein
MSALTNLINLEDTPRGGCLGPRRAVMFQFYQSWCVIGDSDLMLLLMIVLV